MMSRVRGSILIRSKWQFSMDASFWNWQIWKCNRSLLIRFAVNFRRLRLTIYSSCSNIETNSTCYIRRKSLFRRWCRCHPTTNQKLKNINKSTAIQISGCRSREQRLVEIIKLQWMPHPSAALTNWAVMIYSIITSGTSRRDYSSRKMTSSSSTAMTSGPMISCRCSLSYHQMTCQS